MKRVAIYTRVSTQEQVENGNSLEFQTEKLRAFCSLHDFKIVHEYVDKGVSGAKFHRPALDMLKKDINKFDIVLVYKLDRLSRSIKDTMLLVEDFFKPNNVDLISLSENFNTSEAMGMATVGMLSTFAQLERETIKERMIAGKIQSVKNGNYINHAPFGYVKKDRKLVKDEQTRECVEFIFEKLLEGHSTTQVSKLIEAHGYDKLRSAFWHFTTICTMARNPVYVGHTCLMGIKVENTHEPYITEEQQELIISKLDERSRHISRATRLNTYPALFRGLLNCPTCHRKMVTSRSQRKDGSYRIYYFCKYCGADCKPYKYVGETEIENKLLEYFNDFDFEVSVKEDDKPIKKPKDLSKKIEAEENKKYKLQKAWLDDLLTDEELAKLQSEIDERIKLLEEEQRKYDEAIKVKSVKSKLKDFIVNFETVYNKLNQNEKLELLNSFINDITVDIGTEKRGTKYHRYTIDIQDVNYKK